jgi:hypothetical protein
MYLLFTKMYQFASSFLIMFTFSFPDISEANKQRKRNHERLECSKDEDGSGDLLNKRGRRMGPVGGLLRSESTYGSCLRRVITSPPSQAMMLEGSDSTFALPSVGTSPSEKATPATVKSGVSSVQSQLPLLDNILIILDRYPCLRTHMKSSKSHYL